MFLEAKNALVFKKGNETLLIEPWGKDSLRIRSTMERELVDRPWALTEKVKSEKAKIKIENGNGSISNGKIEARVNGNGIITLLKDVLFSFAIFSISLINFSFMYSDL